MKKLIAGIVLGSLLTKLYEQKIHKDSAETQPQYQEIERGADALVPFVKAWKLPLNPEDLYELSYAVLKHAGSAASWPEIEKDVLSQIASLKIK